MADTAKHFQIVKNYFLKTVLTVADSRLTFEVDRGPVNKWFNLELDNIDCLDLSLWKPNNLEELPTMDFECYLDVSELKPGQVLNLPGFPNLEKKEGNSDEIVLEQWTLNWDAKLDADINEELPTVYKRGIIGIRCLYTFLRLLPAWSVRQRLVNQKLTSVPLQLKLRLGHSSNFIRNLILVDDESGNSKAEYEFETFHTPLGDLRLKVFYLRNTNFTIIDNSQRPKQSSQPPLGNTHRRDSMAEPQLGTDLSSSDTHLDLERTRRQEELNAFMQFLDNTKEQVGGSFRTSSDVDLERFKTNLNLNGMPPLEWKRRTSDLRSKLGFYIEPE